MLSSHELAPVASTRRALLIGVPAAGLNVSLAVQRLSTLLTKIGFSSIARCVAEQASRDGILTALDRLVDDAGPDDAVLVHYFGHGGRVKFPDLGDHLFGYVTCHKATRGGPWEAVLDQELSTRMTALASKAGNVTAILDCCFSGEMVRDGEPPPPDQRFEDVTDWVRTAVAPDASLAVESHPGIVRLTGASPKRYAYAVERGGRHIGRLTEAFIAVVEAAGERWSELTWDTLGMQVREHVITALSMEGQWVNLAGPAARRLFSAQTRDAAGTVALVPTEPGKGWLRAGWQQGVRVGDRWDVLHPVDLERRTTVEVVEVDSNRSEVTGERPEAPALPARPVEPVTVARLREELAQREPSRCPVTWSWTRVGDPEPLPHTGASLRRGDRIRIDFTFESKAPLNWFVSVLYIAPDGTPRLLNTRMPQGIELGPRDAEVIGVRYGQPTDGIELPGEGRASLLVLASRRPISLAHIVDTEDPGDALSIQRLMADTLRGHEPERSKGCAWEWIEFTLGGDAT